VSTFTGALAGVQIWNAFVSVGSIIYGHQCWLVVYTRVLQCSPTSVGLARAHPKYCRIKYACCYSPGLPTWLTTLIWFCMQYGCQIHDHMLYICDLLHY